MHLHITQPFPVLVRYSLAEQLHMSPLIMASQFACIFIPLTLQHCGSIASGFAFKSSLKGRKKEHLPLLYVQLCLIQFRGKFWRIIEHLVIPRLIGALGSPLLSDEAGRWIRTDVGTNTAPGNNCGYNYNSPNCL